MSIYEHARKLDLM